MYRLRIAHLEYSLNPFRLNIRYKHRIGHFSEYCKCFVDRVIRRSLYRKKFDSPDYIFPSCSVIIRSFQIHSIKITYSLPQSIIIRYFRTYSINIRYFLTYLILSNTFDTFKHIRYFRTHSILSNTFDTFEHIRYFRTYLIKINIFKTQLLAMYTFQKLSITLDTFQKLSIAMFTFYHFRPFLSAPARKERMKGYICRKQIDRRPLQRGKEGRRRGICWMDQNLLSNNIFQDKKGKRGESSEKVVKSRQQRRAVKLCKTLVNMYLTDVVLSVFCSRKFSIMSPKDINMKERKKVHLTRKMDVCTFQNNQF
jgi:hypothetical protein